MLFICPGLTNNYLTVIKFFILKIYQNFQMRLKQNWINYCLINRIMHQYFTFNLKLYINGFSGLGYGKKKY